MDSLLKAGLVLGAIDVAWVRTVRRYEPLDWREDDAYIHAPVHIPSSRYAIAC